jgi:2-oxoglutarate ferredoxin oxidoreductase subunit delta
MTRGTVVIHRDRCKGCELCVNACPHHLLHLSTQLNTRGYHPVELDERSGVCTGCALCALVCPDVVFIVYRAPAPVRRAA